MEPPEEKLPKLYEALNATNDKIWAGAFTYWHEQRLMVYRYGLVLTGGQFAGPEQIDRLIGAAVGGASERFYRPSNWSAGPTARSRTPCRWRSTKPTGGPNRLRTCGRMKTVLTP